MNTEDILRIIREEIAQEADVPITDVEDNTPFSSLKLDSISSLVVLDRLEKRLAVELNPMHLWDYPTAKKLSEFLTTHMKQKQ